MTPARRTTADQGATGVEDLSHRHEADSVLRALDLVGERWSMAILKESFFGVRRYGQFARNLGIPRPTLSARLKKLVEAGLLDRVPYSEEPVRYEYPLTDAGRELFGAVVVLMQWGDKHLAGPEGPPIVLTHDECGHETHPRLTCDHCGGEIDARGVTPRRGKGFPQGDGDDGEGGALMPARSHDAIIVGGRVAGTTLAIELARRDWDVVVVDRDEFPSTTLSTHGVWPNGVARLDELGVLSEMLSNHDVPMYESRIRGCGHQMEGGYTPVRGHDRAIGPRRIVLDQAALAVARRAGAETRLGTKVVGLVGAGTEEDPVRGVKLSDGETLQAPWVFGADGRGSAVARALGLAKERPMRGEMSMAYGYWRGIEDDGYGVFDIDFDGVVTKVPVEDGLVMLIVNGPPDMTHGSQDDRERKYREMLSRFPETAGPAATGDAELVTDVAVAPEPLMQGYFRTAAGPGWALVGDSGHFKHPGTAQGIGDALEQGFFVADTLSASGGDLSEYGSWRDARSEEHYAWSFAWGHFPRRGSGDVLFRGWAGDPEAAQDLRDTFSRVCPPSRVTSPERLERYFEGR